MAKVEEDVPDEACRAPAEDPTQIEEKGSRSRSAPKFVRQTELEIPIVAPSQNAVGANTDKRAIRCVH